MLKTFSPSRGAVPPALTTVGAMDRFFRRAVLAKLRRLSRGSIRWIDGFGEETCGTSDPDAGPPPVLRIHDASAYREMALGGSVGAGESYMDGLWDTDDLPGLMRLMAADRESLDALETGLGRLRAPLRAILHRMRRNTRHGSRENIRAHYDLSNEMFALFLDPTMTYSCAVFESPETTLQDAQLAKYDRIARKLALRPEHHVVEIGTGWGGFAIHAARRYGCRVTTTTISREQHRVARERVERAGLGGLVRVLDRDYRDLDGTFDRLVSIEMVEAVGHDFLDDFARRCGALLRADGVCAIQAITIADQHYARAVREVDFIKKHIFPGSFIPCVSRLVSAFAGQTRLIVRDIEDIGLHYAKTLRFWRERFRARSGRLAALGFDERFQRMWEFYLAYCEAGFAERLLGTVQLIAAGPRALEPVPRI